MLWNSNWSNWSDFMAMGGYGVYVWGSFGVTALVILVECIAVQARRRAALVAMEESSQQESSYES